MYSLLWLLGSVASVHVAQAQSPGGVSSGLDFWFDPAANVTKTGAIVTAWADKAAGGNGPVVTQATVSLQPAYADGDVLSNYNPYINFTANDRLNQLVTGSAYSKSHTTFGVVNNYVAKGSYTHFIRFTNENNSDAGLHNWGLGHADSQTDKVAMHYITAPFSGGSGSAGTNPYNKFNSNQAIVIGQSMLYGGLIDSSTPASTSVIITHNGNESNWTGATTLASLTPYNYLTVGGGNSFGMNNNKTQEIIHFSRALTLAERQRVNTYLGIKHGLTLEHNYLSGTGATIYTIAGYSANITGIGREDVQGLNQKQSRSVNSTGLVTIGNGTGIATTNALNSNSFSADASFEIIGDNGLAASYATAYLPNVYVSSVPSAFKLMSRIWKVQETGTVGTITVSVPASSKAEVLLVSSSATFTPGVATEITLTSDGNGNMTAQVNLIDGQFFTFGATVIAPGGVAADMQIWVKADNGVVASGSAVNQWTDQSSENHNLVQATPAIQPLLQGASTFFNFNPSVKFDGAGDRLAYKLTRFMSTTSSGTFFGAASNATNCCYQNLGDLGIDNPHMGTYANQQIMWMNSSSPVQINHPTILTANKPTILGYFWNGGAPDVGSGLRQNGTEYNIATTEATAVGNSGPVDGQFTLGSYEGVENWNGHIAEAFLYSRNLTTQEKDRVDTYLSVKYGTTLTHNYLASDGATIYSVSSYSTNITGIGRDNASGLHQKQSKSINARSILTIGLGTALATTNAANANSFAVNNSFEIVGDNGLPYSYSTIYAPTSFTPAGGAGFFRMAATWKVQETGTVGTVVIGAASSTGADYLLVSNSASFPSGSTQELVLTSDGNGNLVASVDLTNGQFFTFGSAEKAPGGILAGLKLWLKGEDITGNDGDQVTIWPSSVLSVPYSVSQATVAARPILYNTTADKLVNFNPAPYFDGGDELTNLTTRLYLNTSPFSLIAASVDQRGAATGSFRAPMGIGDDGNYPGLDFQLDGVSPNGWNPWMTGSTPAEWSGGSARIAPYDLTNRQGNIAALTSSNLASATNNIISYVNGYKETTTLDAYRTNGTNNIGKSVFVGSSGDAQYIGLVPEVIAYEQQLSDPDMQKVQTYLAIKYGTTLGQSNTTTAGLNAQSYNYIATDGTTIWNTATNTGYNYDIAGIGLDNFEGLNQKQSKSVNAGFQPALGLGTVETTNDANGNSFVADKTYMVWGSNGLGTNYSISYTPQSFTVSAPVYLMNRIWKVQETQTVGIVTVSIPGSTTGSYLLVGNSPASLSGGTATEYALVADGNGNLTAQVDLANGQYFTFGKAAFAPGCVADGLDFWFDPATNVTMSGSVVTGWTDRDNGGNDPTVVQATVALQPSYAAGDAVSNYNPYINFSTNTRLNGPIVGSDYSNSHTTFGVVNNYAAKGSYTHFIRLTNENNTDAGLHNWGLGHADTQTDKVALHYIKAPFSGGTGAAGNNIYNKFNSNRTIVIGKSLLYGGLIDSSTPASTSVIVTYNGNESNWTGSANATALIPYDYMTIGGGNSFGMNNNKTSEIIHYSRALTLNERQRVNTYLGVKHGLTLEHNYLAGNSAVIYNVSSFSANILGVGRDDCQQLIQKQSQSVNTPKLSIGLSGTISATNADNPGSFTTDASFLIIGDNGVTSTSLTSFSSVTAACPAPPAADKFTSLAYKATETGTGVGAVFVQFDASGYGFNPAYPLYMQVSSDAAFTSLLASVPMSFSGGIATTNYDFPASSTVYIRFAGNTTSLANICAAPKPLTFHWNGWYYGTKNKTLIGNYNLNNTLTNPVMSVSITDGTSDLNVLLYKPTVNWWPVFDGLGIFIPRYDNNTASQQNSITTTKMKFFAQSSPGVASTSAVAAQTVDFVLRDIDGWYGGKDVVKVYGKIGAATVFPKITKNNNYPFWNSSSLTVSGNTITGGWYPWDLTVLGDAYVSFDSPVEEVYVEYTKLNQYGFKVYNDLRIGAVNITCKIPTPRAPLTDNVYVYKQATPSVQKTNEPVVYKFTIQNTDCANKVINFSDVLPGGLNWVDSTLTTSLNYASLNSYGNNQNLQISSLTVPPGTSYLWATVKGAFPNTYLNQATYTVNGGTGATLLSDDPGETGTAMQPTPLTLVQNDPEANLTVSKTVDKATSPQNSTLTYTYTITNPNASSAVLTTFHDVVPGELTYIGSSLSGLSGGYTSSTAVTPYSGSAVLTMRNLSVAANSSLTFTVQANTNSYTLNAVATNVAQVTPDPLSGFRIQEFNSNSASTTITAPPTITISTPLNTTTALNPTISGTATAGAQVVLTSSSGGTLCTTTATVGGTWSCPVNLTAGPQTLSAVASNSAGISSPATTQITALAAPIQANNPPALTATPGTSNTGNAAAELTPSGGTTPYSYSNDTGNGSCSAVAGATALPTNSLTVNSSTGSYSYTAPATPGVYYFCVKVCDATPTCVTKTYTLTVVAPAGVGTLDCSTAQILGISAGTPGNGVLKLSINVTTAGPLPVTVSGSGLLTSPNPYTINATATGAQTFYLPLSYSGTAFAAGTTITVTGAGVCTVDMTAVTPKTVTTSVLNLGPACSPATAATLVK